MIHPHAAVGFQRASEAYERGRPEYPESAVAFATRSAGLGPGKTALDLGAGTGKFTRLLAPHGAQLIAVEPIASMRGRLVAAVPGACALEGTAEAIPLPDRSVHTVFVAQAFHWFDGPRALSEIARVLVPGGTLVLVWNVRDERVPWVARLTELLEPHGRDAPSYRSGAWRRAFDVSAFDARRFATFGFEQAVPTLDVLEDRVGSISFVASLDAKQRRALLDEVRALGHAHGVELFPYVTEIHVFARR